MQRRTLLKLGASSLALTAVGAGLWVQRGRRLHQRQSDPIMGDWPALGPGLSWLLPGLVDADMYVPDRPHAHGEDDDPQTRQAIRRVRHFQVTTNHQRLRGVDVGTQPAAGVTRLLAVGDSTTFGWGVPGDQSWPARLEAELNARGGSVEVLNAGVPSLGFAGILAYLQHIAPTLGVHGVIISRRPDMPASRSSFPGALAGAAQGLGHVPMLMVLPPVSRFDLYGQGVWPGERPELLAAFEGRVDVPVLELTPAFREAQGRRGHDLVAADGELRVVSSSTGAVLLRAAIPPHDLPREVYQLFESDPDVFEPLIFDGGHMDAEGNALAARLVADEIGRLAWLG